MNELAEVSIVNRRTLTRHRGAWTEEGVEANVEAITKAGNMDVEVAHKMLIN